MLYSIRGRTPPAGITNQVRVHVSSVYCSAARDGFFVGVNITNQVETSVNLELPSGGVMKVSEKYLIDMMIAETRFFDAPARSSGIVGRVILLFPISFFAGEEEMPYRTSVNFDSARSSFARHAIVQTLHRLNSSYNAAT